MSDDIREPLYGAQAAEVGQALRRLLATGRRPETPRQRPVLTPFRVALLRRRT
ncbi:hypothetical protein [Streptomyces sp. NBC_01092]|uniref:hypothetical protein n=1 Tax=Streptomyces sp. NBC_01092 TaxID=2903748 RepID=UPI00386E376A|nr:hypothetical protein OG254_14375 [Streptomyces sp. NBC_01092]